MVGHPNEPRQTMENLRGEVAFRAKLAVQHVTGDVLLPDYYHKAEHDLILKDRIEATHTRMAGLAARGIALSPFLELGAERGQRSLVLSNDFGASGIAADISFHQLKCMEHFAELFRKPRLPLRVCCDANRLPFKAGSFPFVFCFEFLHHFPALGPVVREIHRVTGDAGYFYFDEEPFRRAAKVALYRRRDKIYSERTLRRHTWVRLLESFISEPRSDEVEHGVVENEELSLTEWSAALALFESSDVDLVSLERLHSKLGRKPRLRNLLNFLLGGTIQGLSRKAPGSSVHGSADLHRLLTCPDCLSRAATAAGSEPSLVEVPNGFRCERCAFTYPYREGVIMLLPAQELRLLYPEVAAGP